MTLDGEAFKGPDPKPQSAKGNAPIRKVDKTVTKRVVKNEGECFCAGKLCDGRAATGHHIVPRGAPHFGDDVVPNIAPCSGDGTTGCHGLVEAYDVQACRLLGRWIKTRPETIKYVLDKLGREAGADFLRRRYHVRGKL